MSSHFSILIATALLLSISGCANKLKITPVVASVPHGIKDLVLVNDNEYSSAVRRSLIKEGFNVKAMPSINTVTNKTVSTDITHVEPEATFGIRHSGRLSGNNPCLTNGLASHFSEYEYELVNLKSNQTLLFVSEGGWTEWCTGAPTVDTTDLFGDLSKTLATTIK